LSRRRKTGKPKESGKWERKDGLRTKNDTPGAGFVRKSELWLRRKDHRLDNGRLIAGSLDYTGA
jgi:hypothetical protein